MTVQSASERPGFGTDATVGPVDRESTTAGLLAEALAGDAAAWAQIVAEHTQMLWWIARGYRLDDATAMDVVQTVWLQLLRFGDRIQDHSRLPGWLATTARRESLRRLSGHEVLPGRPLDVVDLTAPSPEEMAVDDDQVGRALAAFAQLDPADQRLLRLVCAVPPKSYKEIAALLNWPVGSVGPSRQRAIRRLKAILNEEDL